MLIIVEYEKLVQQSILVFDINCIICHCTNLEEIPPPENE
jgi:hypothetical protein